MGIYPVRLFTEELKPVSDQLPGIKIEFADTHLKAAWLTFKAFIGLVDKSSTLSDRYSKTTYVNRRSLKKFLERNGAQSLESSTSRSLFVSHMLEAFPISKPMSIRPESIQSWSRISSGKPETAEEFLKWCISNPAFNSKNKTFLHAAYERFFSTPYAECQIAHRPFRLDRAKLRFLHWFQGANKHFPNTTEEFMQKIFNGIVKFNEAPALVTTAMPRRSEDSIDHAPHPVSFTPTSSAAATKDRLDPVSPIDAEGRFDLLDAKNPFSNWYSRPLPFEGLTYTCAEAAFQASKFSAFARTQFVGLTGAAAQRKANELLSHMTEHERSQFQQRWTVDGGNIEAMKRILSAKFQDPSLKRILLSTGDSPLLAHGEKGKVDPYWSDVPKADGTLGLNFLGRCLRDTRSALKKSPPSSTTSPDVPPTPDIDPTPVVRLPSSPRDFRAARPTKMLFELPEEGECPPFKPLTDDELRTFLAKDFPDLKSKRAHHGRGPMLDFISTLHSGRADDAFSVPPDVNQILTHQIRYVLSTIKQSTPETQRSLLMPLIESFQDCIAVAQRSIDDIYQKLVGTGGFEAGFKAFIREQKNKAIDAVLYEMYPELTSPGHKPSRDNPEREFPHLKSGFVQELGREIGFRMAGAESDIYANAFEARMRKVEFLHRFHEKFSISQLIQEFVLAMNSPVSEDEDDVSRVFGIQFMEWGHAAGYDDKIFYNEDEKDLYPSYSPPPDDKRTDDAMEAPYISEQTALEVFKKLGYIEPTS